MPVEYLFVYGTLRKSTSSEMYHLLAREALFIGDATFQGTLYDIVDYPGVLPSDNPDRRVKGEVYRLSDSPTVWNKLDEYEGFGERFPQPNEFIREKRKVTLNDGTQLTAWIYLYNWDISEHIRIDSGDYIAYTSSLKT